MILKALRLRNFRNYDEEVVTFSPGINLIFGKNGAGKTNLLEALYLLSTGRSFRTNHLSDLIRKGADYFYIEAHFEKDSISQTLSIGSDGKTKKIHHNSTILQSFSHLLGIIPLTLYAPRDGELIAGAPHERRRFLNVQIAQRDPAYVHHLLRYHKALKQRNALLKMKSEAGIESWEEMMTLSSVYLIQKRKKLIETLEQKMTTYVSHLSGEIDIFTLNYAPSIPLKQPDELKEAFRKSRKKELATGATLNGPHRDDFKIHYQGREAKFFASEGQKRTCITALKLSEWELLSSHFGNEAMMGIDDFAIHLDESRTQLLHKEMQKGKQIFLTTPSEEHVATFPHDRLLFVENGLVSAQESVDA